MWLLNPKRTPRTSAWKTKSKPPSPSTKPALNLDNRIKSCTVDYMDLTGTSFFVNSEGTYIEQDKLYVWSRITASAASNGVFTFSREEIGSTAGYELFDEQTPEAVRRERWLNGQSAAGREISQRRQVPSGVGTQRGGRVCA